jgi:hypothetical protein
MKMLQRLGVEDAGAARDGQRVELAGGPGRIGAQSIEKWCGVTVSDAAQHCAV